MVQPVVWEWDVGTKFAVLTSIENVPDHWEITKGLSRAKSFPKDAQFRMDPKFPKYVALADSMSNVNRMLVVSRRVKEFLEERAPRRVEYLPVKLLNHKKKVASDEYFVVNPLAIVDCIDTKKSRVRWNDIDPEKLAACSNVVLKPKSIDGEHLLFRPKHLEYYVMVLPELAEALEAEGFTGLRFTPVDEFES